MDEIEKETIYTFHFGTTDKTVQLTQQQLDYFPYLNAIVTHTDCFSSVQNEDGEYVLSYRIRYSWFMAIFRSIINDKPSALFTELSQDANVLSMLHLYDYLGINPLPVPLLKDEYLLRLNSSEITNEKTRIEYRRAKNLAEVRDTAVLFIIALTKNEYNLNDLKTLNKIFSLIMIIRSKLNIFGPRLCHHMFTIVKEYCFTFFSRDQQRELRNAQRSIQSNKSAYSVSLCNDDQPLPYDFQNAFTWKGVYVSIKENENTDHLLNAVKESTDHQSTSPFNMWEGLDLFTEFMNTDLYDLPMEYGNISWSIPHLHEVFDSSDWELHDYLVHLEPIAIRRPHLSQFLANILTRRSSLIDNPFDSALYEIEKEKKKNEAKSARLGYFNTLPKRPTVDKFKHRSGPKAQKHR